MFLSVIICTRNRAEEIAECLPEVARQADNFDDVEVIVIDNGSTDNTRMVVEKTANELTYQFRYFFEPIPGLCQARNRGRVEAMGLILAYVDDDARIGSTWVKQIRQGFLEQNFDSLTGKVHVKIIGESDFEFTEDILSFFGKRDYGEAPKELFFPNHPIGCNMAFRAEIFDAIGGFNTNLKLYGDETDFFRRAVERGFKMFYLPEMEITQVIPTRRITNKELSAKSYKWGQGSATLWLLTSPNLLKRFGKSVEYFVRSLYMIGSYLIRRDFGRFFTLWYNCGFLVQTIRGLK